MKRHQWGPEIKHGTGHFQRRCERKGCRWRMVVIRKPKGRFSGERSATEVSYTDGVRTVSEVPDCIESGEKPHA